MIYPLSILITGVFAILAAIGVFDISIVTQLGTYATMTNNSIPDSVGFITALAGVWSIIGLAVFALQSGELAKSISRLANSDGFVTTAQARLDGLKEHYKDLILQYKDLPQDILANEDSPIKSAITAISRAESDLEDAKNRKHNAIVAVESYRIGPMSILYKMYVK